MLKLNKKLQTVPYVVKHLLEITKEDKAPFAMLFEAPWYIRLLSKGQYCVYKDVIYVPNFHLELVKSPYEEDRTLATSKLLPCVMLLHDYNNISLFRMLCLLYNLNYQLHYFLYEFLFLKASNSKFYTTITMGFLASRKSWFKKLKPIDVERLLRNILEENPKNYQISPKKAP